MSFVTTPHINAEKDAFGRTVLMPGDPLRSKFIAENFLENAVLVNNMTREYFPRDTAHLFVLLVQLLL